MFDLKKRNSLTLSREVEEFRRVALRRRVKAAAVDCESSHTASSGVCGSYSSGLASDSFCGSEQISKERSPVRRSPFKPRVPPKPAHLQSPLWPGQVQSHSLKTAELPLQHVNGLVQDQSPERSCGELASCVSLTQICLALPSPVRGGGNRFLNGESGVQVSPARCSQGISNLTSSSVLGSPSPGKRVFLTCSPQREGGHSPAKLSPSNQSPLKGKLRTPSPVLGRMASYSPAKNSKSWLGLHRIPSGKLERQKMKTEKSLSVPDLIFFLDDGRIATDRAGHSPLKQPASPSRPAAAIKSPIIQRSDHSTNEANLSINGQDYFLPKMDSISWERKFTIVNGKGIHEKIDDGKITYGSKYSCLWNKDATEHSMVHNVCNGEQKDEKMIKREEEEEETNNKENTDQKLYNIARELLQTERAYVARLHLLDQVFCSHLTEEAGRGSFPPEVIRNIFSNISSIYSFHNQFLLPDLEKCISHWHEKPGLGNVLLQHAPFLRMYADYVRNFDQAMELVRTWTERSSAFRDVIHDIQSKEMCGSLTLQHHMLEPVQRVPRYEMLLRDYLKKLPEDNPDYEFAHKSLQTISLAATHSNKAIQKAESLRRLLEIYEMVGDEEVINPTNEFLKEGRLVKLAARNTSAMERHLFLFNNFLLCCTPKFSLVGQRFTVRCRIGVDGMHVQQTSNEGHSHTFQVSGKERTLELQASSEQDRDKWIKVIQGAIDVFMEKNESFKMALKVTNVEEATEELGQRAPRWIRDNEVTLCMKCQEPFNALTRRRHHCRACGCVVCWKCSDNKVALEYDGNKLNKVCKVCYSILTCQRGDKIDGKKRRLLESEESLVSTDSMMCSFLLYSDDSKTWQQLWCVITRTEPHILYLYTAPLEVKPLTCIHLPGCDIEDSPQALKGQTCFSLRQSKTTHTFSCDGLELKESWLDTLKVAVARRHHEH